MTPAQIEAAAPFHCYNPVRKCDPICQTCKDKAQAALSAAEAAGWQPPKEVMHE